MLLALVEMHQGTEIFGGVRLVGRPQLRMKQHKANLLTYLFSNKDIGLGSRLVPIRPQFKSKLKANQIFESVVISLLQCC